MCNHGFIISFADATCETGMNGHESNIQDAASNEGVCYLFTYYTHEALIYTHATHHLHVPSHLLEKFLEQPLKL